jgi:general secretion pathway protein K
VLWLTAALSAIGLAVANNVRGETERTSNGIDDTKSWFIARGAIERACLHIMWRVYTHPDGQPIYYRAGQPGMDLDFPGAKVTVEIIPETSKLNVNNATPEELLRLLEALQVPAERATEITSAILDWRSPADRARSDAFDAFYLSQSPSFRPRHASYQENEELLRTKGITPGLYYGESLDNSPDGLRDCLSVFGGSGAVDVNTARPATLQAIGLSPDNIRAIVQRRLERPFLDSEDLAQAQHSLGTAGRRLGIGGVSMYTLRATARLKGPDGRLSDLRRTVAALVQFTFAYTPGPKARPYGYQVLRWYDRP